MQLQYESQYESWCTDLAHDPFLLSVISHAQQHTDAETDNEPPKLATRMQAWLCHLFQKKVWVLSLQIAYSHVPAYNSRTPFLTLARRPAPPLPKFSERQRWSIWGCWHCIFIYYTITILEELEAPVQAPALGMPRFRPIMCGGR
jgi:hypothetical protein